MDCSTQLRRYLSARRSGMTMMSAAVFAPIGIGEARLHEVAEAAGEYADIITDEMPSPMLQPAAEAAPEKPTIQRASVNGVRDERAVIAAPMDGAASLTEGDIVMPKHDEPLAADEPDFDPLIELSADTLRGDIRDAFLGWFKSQPKSWPFMSESEQRDMANAVDSFSYGLIKRAAKLIAGGERPTIVAKLVEYREKDGIEAKLKLAPTGDIVAQLHEACGQEVLLVATGAADFSGQRDDPAIDADQGKLRGIGDEYDEDA